MMDVVRNSISEQTEKYIHPIFKSLVYLEIYYWQEAGLI